MKVISRAVKMSDLSIPKILPKRMCSRWAVVSNATNKTIPRPNIPEKIMPIIVSSLILLLSEKKPVPKAHNIPAMKAPISKGIPTI